MHSNHPLQELLQETAQNNTLIIVEGIEDKKALQTVGINNIKTLNKQPLYKIVEEVVKETKEVINLTDLDKKGKQLYAQLQHPLQQRGITINNTLRHFLFRNTKLTQIEGIVRYLKREEHK